MNVRFFLLCTALCVLAISPCRADTLTFDDLKDPGILDPGATGQAMSSSYGGMSSWSNMFYKNSIVYTTTYGPSGYAYAMISSSNVAYNAYAGAAEINCESNFDFTSVYLTAAWNSNLSLQVQGFVDDTNLLYNQTVVLSATNSTLFTFNYLNVNRLTFNASGGLDAGFTTGSGAHFGMDNFTFTFVPEPSSLLLTAMGALVVCAFVRRKRRQ